MKEIRKSDPDCEGLENLIQMFALCYVISYFTLRYIIWYNLHSVKCMELSAHLMSLYEHTYLLSCNPVVIQNISITSEGSSCFFPVTPYPALAAASMWTLVPINQSHLLLNVIHAEPFIVQNVWGACCMCSWKNVCKVKRVTLLDP